MKKKLFALTLAFLITFALIPTIAFGATGVPYVDNKGIEQIPVDTVDVVSSSGSGTVSWDENLSSWYSVSGTVLISDRVEVTGDVNLILTDGARLEASAGIQVASGNSLTIYSQSEGTGTLIANAVANSGDAGIGGNGNNSGDGENGGTVNIYGGTIEATGANISGSGGAGIGGGGGIGAGGTGGIVNIYGGTVEATGGIGFSGRGAGIGGVGTLLYATGEIRGNTVVIASSIPSLGSGGIVPQQGIVFLPVLGVLSGIVYGDTALPDNLTLTSSQTLTVPANTSLTIPKGVTLTNNNTTTPIDNQGTIRVAGILSGTGTISGTHILYQLRLLRGHITSTPVPTSQFYSQGDSVNVLADTPSEMVFSYWSAIVNGANSNTPLSSTTSATSTVTMPAGAVELTAYFLDNPTLTFDATGGTTSSNPNTADDTPLGLMFALFALIVVAGAALIVRRRFVKN